MTNREKQDITPSVENDPHLTVEEIELYAAGKLHGAALLAALIHLENCSECFRRLPALDEAEFLDKLLGGDDQ